MARTLISTETFPPSIRLVSGTPFAIQESVSTWTEAPITTVVETVIGIDYSPYYERIATALETIAENSTKVTEDVKAIRIAAANAGIVDSVIVTDAGAGYTEAPAVTISSPEDGNDVATATASVSDNTVDTITVANPGLGYRVIPTITVGPPAGITSFIEFSSELEIELNDVIEYKRNFYLVKSLKTLPEGQPYKLSTTPPDHTSGSKENGDALLEYKGRRAIASVKLQGGDGIKSISPYELLNVASMYSYYVSHPEEITPLLDTVNSPNAIPEVQRLALLSTFVNSLPKLP